MLVSFSEWESRSREACPVVPVASGLTGKIAGPTLCPSGIGFKQDTLFGSRVFAARSALFQEFEFQRLADVRSSSGGRLVRTGDPQVLRLALCGFVFYRLPQQ